jgi:hypothetical protein
MSAPMPSTRDLLYFVGSVPLKDSEDVFRQLSREVGPYLRRIPDGETGERGKWIVFQQRMLQEHPAMEIDPTQPPLPVNQSDGTVLREIRRVRLKLDADPETVVFDTGYDRAALSAYDTFRRLRGDGTIPKGVRFQFALPTPMATGLMYVSPNGRDRYLYAYERAILKALSNILAGIPHDELSIQFDVCQEVLLFENYFPERAPDYKEVVLRQFGRLSAAVPKRVELGFHLCYGSPGDQPLIRLRDAGVLVELMNGIDASAERKVDFIHIPVPRQADDAFFSPLRQWQRPAETRLYLGLLQYNDTTGNQARIAAARRFVSDFGVGAECGFGRTDPNRVPGLLAGHRAAAELLASTAAQPVPADSGLGEQR